MRAVLAGAALAACLGGGAASAAGPDGGAVRALAVDRAGGSVFAGTPGGVFRSDDRGKSWSGVSEGLTSLDVTALAFAPDGTLVAAAGGGVFRSRDGRTWAPAGSAFAGARVLCLLADPARPGSLYAAVSDQGLLHSEDSGATWKRILPDRTIVLALAADAAGGRVLAGTGDGVFVSPEGERWERAGTLDGPVTGLLSAGTPPVLYAAVQRRGVFRSSDHGKTWTATAVADTEVFTLAACGISLCAGSLDGVFASHDGGATWSLSRFSPVTALAAADAEGSVLYAASPSGAWRREEGRPWTPANTGLAAAAVRALRFDPRTPGHIWAGTERGLFESSDGGARWTAVSTAANVGGVSALLPAGRNGGELLVGSDGAIARSLAGGESWATQPTVAVFSLAADLTEPDTIYASTRGRLLKSRDGGLGWEDSSKGLGKTFALGLAVDPAAPSVLYAATAGEGVWRSADGAKTWKPFGAELEHMIVRCVAIGPDGAIYAGADGGVFRSPATSRNWTPSGSGLPRVSVYALAVDPAPAPAGAVYAGTASGLFSSLDSGATWSSVEGAPPAAISAIALDPASNRIAVGTLGAGVFVLPRPGPAR